MQQTFPCKIKINKKEMKDNISLNEEGEQHTRDFTKH